MPTLLKIWKTGNQERLARKADITKTSESYSIPEDADEYDKQPGYSVMAKLPDPASQVPSEIKNCRSHPSDLMLGTGGCSRTRCHGIIIDPQHSPVKGVGGRHITYLVSVKKIIMVGGLKQV